MNMVALVTWSIARDTLSPAAFFLLSGCWSYVNFLVNFIVFLIYGDKCRWTLYYGELLRTSQV